MNADELRQQTAQQIETAFAQTPYPGDDKVAVYARYGHSLADDLRGKHWREVPLEVLYAHRWEIFLLTPETFRFYSPVFMLAALYHPNEVESLSDNLIFSLTPQREEHIHNYQAGEYNDYFSRRAAAYSAEEKAAVLAFLRAFAILYAEVPLVYDIDLNRQTIAFWQRA